jgi:hypothetical protein
MDQDKSQLGRFNSSSVETAARITGVSHDACLELHFMISLRRVIGSETQLKGANTTEASVMAERSHCCCFRSSSDATETASDMLLADRLMHMRIPSMSF